jgi:hypothetical protein
MSDVAYKSWITWATGAHCPTSQELLREINRRSTITPESLLAFEGVLQFGLVTEPQDKQLSNAQGFWSNYLGDCDNCGGYVGEGNRQPQCGHIYCGLCKSRGRDDDCAYGQCEDAPVMSAKA